MDKSSPSHEPDSFEPKGTLTFVVLLIFSIPVGVHHMYVDPGVSEVMKVVQWVFTFAVAIPSFLTMFNIGAVLERAGRKRGATGRIDWMWKQDWWNPVVAAQLVGRLTLPQRLMRPCTSPKFQCQSSRSHEPRCGD